MASEQSSMPFSSLRPLPVGGRKPKNVGEFIARIQTERGFRNVTEASLREEIAAKQRADPKDEDVAMTGSDDDQEEEAPKDVHAVRAEILRNIDSAYNTAVLTLDFVSLLLTKHNPNQGGATLSQQLRDMAGIGTLGVSKFKDSVQDGDRRRREEKRKDAKDISVGWTIMDIDETRKAAEKATAKLSKEIEREEQYWKEVLAVKQNGWSVCRLPNERQTLGVRFGFTEASPEFRNKSLAPLRRADDGSVILEHSRSGIGRQRVSVAISREKLSEPTGQSVMGSSAPDAAPLQTRVLEARNSIFAQELWHELHREAHQLASYGVRASETEIIYQPRDGPKITLSVETLQDLATTPPADTSQPDYKIAELTQLSLHLLLSYAHRQNEVQRLRPAPPHQRRHQQYQQYHLLRPIISRSVHDYSIKQSTQFVGRIVRVLRQLGTNEAAFTLSSPQLSTADLISPPKASSNRPTAAQSLINLLTAPADFSIELTTTPTSRLQVRGRTWFLPFTTTQYQVNLLPAKGTTDLSSNDLQQAFPPYRDRDGYPDLTSLKSYLVSAVPRALVAHYLPQIRSLGKDEDDWSPSVSGNSLQSDAINPAAIVFELEETKDALELAVSATWHVDGNARAKTWRYTGTPTEAEEKLPDISAIVSAVASSSELS